MKMSETCEKTFKIRFVIEGDEMIRAKDVCEAEAKFDELKPMFLALVPNKSTCEVASMTEVTQDAD